MSIASNMSISNTDTLQAKTHAHAHATLTQHPDSPVNQQGKEHVIESLFGDQEEIEVQALKRTIERKNHEMSDLRDKFNSVQSQLLVVNSSLEDNKQIISRQTAEFTALQAHAAKVCEPWNYVCCILYV